MPQKEEVAIDRLLSIIQTIQLGRKTGLLTARRGEGANSEKGTIVFTRGLVTEVRLGQRTGTDAFNALSTWEHCVFTFAVSDTQTPSHPSSTAPISGISEPVTTGNPPSFVAISPLRRSSGSLAGEERNLKQMLPSTADLGAPYHIKLVEAALRTIDNLGLSRIHRQLFLLIDGQRTIADFSRLTGRSQNEIYMLLRDLERATVIRIPSEASPR